VYLEDRCFHAQQCAEKAVKAVFIRRGERFPFIHDLEELLGVLSRGGFPIPKYVWEAQALSRYAAVTRYPNRTDSVSPRQYRRAVRIATAVLSWAERQVAASRAGPGKKK
jgi:HEPN domain-containing protein